MKNKIKQLVKKEQSSENSQLAKITNNTLESERKEILNNGRKFKYPVQYSKKKLVINTVIIATIVITLGLIALWHQLYVAQNTNDLVYRITTVLPLPVANVDGQNALYSDYLADYRANMALSENKKETLELIKDKNKRSEVYKRQAMDNTVRNAYAIKLARENGISVSTQEIDEVIKKQRIVSGVEISESAFNKIIKDNYGFSSSEWRRIFAELPLLQQKVSEKIDSNALNLKNEVASFLASNNNDFSKIVDKFGDKVEVGASGNIKISNFDGGLTKTGMPLKNGEVSKVFVAKRNSKDAYGYYFVKLVSKNDKELSYEYIKVKFTEFDNRITEFEKSGKISKYIKI